MKIIASLHASRDELGSDLFEKLVSLYPEGHLNDSFRIELNTDDSVMELILKTLDQERAIPYNPWSSIRPFNYHLEFRRHYDPADLEACAFLVPAPQVCVDGGGIQDGHINILTNPRRGGIRSKEPIASAAGLAIVVSDALLVKLERENFQGLVFRLVYSSMSSGSLPTDFWELYSNVMMPPLSSRMAIVNSERNRDFDRESEDCYLKEGWDTPDILYGPVEYRYNQSDLIDMQSFDVAITREHIGSLGARRLVVSQRFYQFCIKNKLKMGWGRVHVDPD